MFKMQDAPGYRNFMSNNKFINSVSGRIKPRISEQVSQLIYAFEYWLEVDNNFEAPGCKKLCINCLAFTGWNVKHHQICTQVVPRHMRRIQAVLYWPTTLED